MLKQIKEGKPLEHRFQRRALDDVPANTTSNNQNGGKGTATDHKPQGNGIVNNFKSTVKTPPSTTTDDKPQGNRTVNTFKSANTTPYHY